MGEPAENIRTSRRDRERAFRASLILEAAEYVFATQGFQAASIEEIASRAEVAIATLYKMFGSKEAIFAALIEYRQSEFLVEVGAFARGRDTPPSQLDALIEATFRYFAQHQAAFRIYLAATHGFPWHIRTSLGERAFMKHQEFVRFIADILREGMRGGAWPKEDPAQLSVAAMGALNGLLMQWQTADAGAEPAEHIESAVRMVRRLVGARETLAALAPRRQRTRK